MTFSRPTDPVTVVDPLDPIKLFLASEVTAADVVKVLPSDWTPETATRPTVVLADDGGRMSWPVSTRTLVRVTVWCAGRTEARAVAATCLGRLLCKTVPSIASVTPGTTVTDGRDSRNGGIFATFAVNITARTTRT